MAAGVLLALLFGALPGTAGEVYRTVDAEGNVSFGDRPQGDTAERMDLPTKLPSGSDVRKQHQRTERAVEAYASERRERAQARAARAEEARERKRKCSAARDEQQRIETAAHLFYRDEQGNKRIIDGAEYDAVIEDARATVDTWCS